MKNYKKILVAILVISILIVFTIVLVILLKHNKENIDDTNLKSTQNYEYVKLVEDTKTLFNVNKCINDMLEEFYIKEEYKYNDSMFLPRNLVEMMDFENGEKVFYIEKAYVAEMEDSINVYFAKGYIICSGGNKKIIDDSIKKDINLMLIIDNEYDTGRLNLYNDGGKDIFKYSDDISKTEILKRNGLKIEKTNSNPKSLEESIMENEFFQNKNLTPNIPEGDLVKWYYTDYLIKKADENHEFLPEVIAYNYEGNFDEGYKVIGVDYKQFLIKPSTIPMEYEISEIE